jgi:hypothetical protein
MKKEITTEERSVGFTIAFITHQLFDEIREGGRNGVLYAYDMIVDLAHRFEEEFKDVQWGISDKHDDWESECYKWVNEQLKNR